MQKLSLLDATFLYAETDNTPMHVAGLQHFELPPGGEKHFFESLKRYVEDRVHVVPFMMRRLKPTPLGMDHPIWVLDTGFEIDYHVQRLRLPKPGNVAQLEEAVAALHEEPLDRARPLWQYWLIEGLESGHVAWYTKYHHACLDGMAGQAIIDIFFSDTPAIKPPPPPPSDQDDEEEPGVLSMLWDATRRAGAQPVQLARMVPEIARTAQGLASRAVRSVGGMGAIMQRVPRTRLNVAIGPERIVALGSIPLRPLKAAGKRHGCSVNDAFLAVCAGGLREWLAELGELPARPLVGGAPVSLRQPGDKSMHNQVTMMACNLATDVDDPVERMLAIRDSMRDGIAVVHELDQVHFGELTILGLPIAFQGVSTLANRLRLGSIIRMPMNVVVSNIPGPRQAVYLNGAKMLTHYPVSIPAHGMALNVTVQSYVDRMDFSLTACRRTLPDAHELRDRILDAWDELRRAAGARAVRSLPLDPASATG